MPRRWTIRLERVEAVCRLSRVVLSHGTRNRGQRHSPLVVAWRLSSRRTKRFRNRKPGRHAAARSQSPAEIRSPAKGLPRLAGADHLVRYGSGRSCGWLLVRVLQRQAVRHTGNPSRQENTSESVLPEPVPRRPTHRWWRSEIDLVPARILPSISMPSSIDCRSWTHRDNGSKGMTERSSRSHAGAPVRARVSVGNTQEATWLAPRTSELLDR